MGAQPKSSVIHCVLVELGIPLGDYPSDERTLVQRGIYLASLVDVDLGYSFGWYSKAHSPLSVALYNDLNEAYDDSMIYGFGKERLNPHLAELLVPLREALKPPQGLTQLEWATLLAKLVFLQRTARYDQDRAFSFIAEDEVGRVSRHLPAAVDTLAKLNILPIAV